MNPLWDYVWPALAAGLLIGVVGGLVAFRRANLRRILLISAAVTLAAGGLWHWPIGGAERFASSVDRSARRALDYYEMTLISGKLQRGPLTRTLVLAGPADDFQHSELVRLLSQLPGVSSATWSPRQRAVPLFVEGAAGALAGFLVGLLLAYLVELHRRYNAQWKW